MQPYTGEVFVVSNPHPLQKESKGYKREGGGSETPIPHEFLINTIR